MNTCTLLSLLSLGVMATPELSNKMASFSEPLTVDNIRKIWKTEFLPNIKKEIRNELKTETEKVNCLTTVKASRLD